MVCLSQIKSFSIKEAQYTAVNFYSFFWRNFINSVEQWTLTPAYMHFRSVRFFFFDSLSTQCWHDWGCWLKCIQVSQLGWNPVPGWTGNTKGSMVDPSGVRWAAERTQGVNIGKKRKITQPKPQNQRDTGNHKNASSLKTHYTKAAMVNISKATPTESELADESLVFIRFCIISMHSFCQFPMMSFSHPDVMH